MSGPPNGKRNDDTSRGVSGRMIDNRSLAKDVVKGKGRPKIDYSTGMPGLVAIVRKTLTDKSLSLYYREGFLSSLDRVLKEKIESFFATYQWRFNITFEEDIISAIKSGALSKEIQLKLPNLFPEIAERNRRSQQLDSARELYKKILQQKKELFKEELFYAWVLDNWEYLCTNSFTHKQRPPENGLFFFEPTTPVVSIEDMKKYLFNLYKEFRYSLNRLGEWGGKGEYGGYAAHPIIMYQQFMRWIALDSQTNVRGKRLSSYQDYQLLASFPEQLRELTRMINSRKTQTILDGNKKEVYTKEEILQKIQNHLKEHKIPQAYTTSRR